MNQISPQQDLNEDAYNLRLLDADDAQGWMPPMVNAVVTEESVSSEERIHALLDEARREGLTLGREEGRREYEAAITQVNQLIQALARPLNDIDERVEVQLAELALAIGKQLALFNLAQNPQAIATLVRTSLTQLPVATEKVAVKLNPADAQRIRADADLDSQIEVLEDPGVQVGGCLLMAGSSRIDQRFESRLATLIEEMFGAEVAAERQAMGCPDDGGGE